MNALDSRTCYVVVTVKFTTHFLRTYPSRNLPFSLPTIDQISSAQSHRILYHQNFIMESSIPSLIKLSRPFLTPHQTDQLQSETGLKGPIYSQLLTQVNHIMIQVSRNTNIRFPVRTVATASLLFQKAILYNKFGLKIPVTELTIACLLISSKVEDTPKRAKDIITTVYQTRNGPSFPPLSANQVEEIKQRVLALERQILETIAFDFRITHPFKYIVVFSKSLEKASLELALMAWTIALDLYSTTAPLKYPSQTTALGCLVLAARLKDTIITPIDLALFASDRQSINGVLGDLLDYYIAYLTGSKLVEKYGSLEVSKFMSFRMDLNTELAAGGTQIIPKGAPQHVRDAKLSDKGTVRYIIDLGKEHTKTEKIG